MPTAPLDAPPRQHRLAHAVRAAARGSPRAPATRGATRAASRRSSASPTRRSPTSPRCAPTASRASTSTATAGPARAPRRLAHRRRDDHVQDGVGRRAAPGRDEAPDAVALGPRHAAQASTLATLTRPGPFGPRTIELGDYFGSSTASGSSRWPASACTPARCARSAASARTPTSRAAGSRAG